MSCFGTPGGLCGAGSPANFVVFDSELAWYLSTNGITARPLYTPQAVSVYPVCTYTCTSVSRPQSQAGGAGIPTAQYLLTCWGPDLDEVNTLSATVRSLFDGYSGEMGNATVRYCAITEETANYNPPVDASDQGIFQRVITLEITYIEA